MRKKAIYIKKFNLKKASKAVVGLITIPLACKVLIDILNIKEIIGDKWIHAFGIDKKNGIYYILNKCIDLGKFQDLLYGVIVLLCISVIVVQIVFFCKNNLQEKVLIVLHNSLNQTSFRFSGELQNEYIVKKICFNQYDTFHSNLPIHEMINRTITEVDLKANEIRQFIAKGYHIGYAGIANIPATFMLGYELGDENAKIYFHKFHGRQTSFNFEDDKFHKLTKKNVRGTFEKEILQESLDVSKSGNIVILISLTQPIKESDFASITGKNDYIIKYTTSDKTDYDVIDSENQIDDYTNQILSDIAEIQKKPNINQIRIGVAASSAFIFGLGTKFSKTQNKTTIIFHFEKDNYSWGINVTDKKAVII